MRISSTHAYVQGFSCLLQFGEGKKKHTHKHTQKLQLQVCSGPEAVRVQTEQTASTRLPTPALPGDTGQVSLLVTGDNSTTRFAGRMGDSGADSLRAVLGMGPGTAETRALSRIVLFLEDRAEAGWHPWPRDGASVYRLLLPVSSQGRRPTSLSLSTLIWKMEPVLSNQAAVRVLASRPWIA